MDDYGTGTPNTTQYRDQDDFFSLPGMLMLAVLTLVVLFALYFAYQSFYRLEFGISATALGVVGAITFFAANGFKIVSPGEALLLVFFGKYTGTVKEQGFYFFNPLLDFQRVSIKQLNRVTDILKINDATGNPIEVAATLSFSIEDVSKAAFAVEDYQAFVQNQCDASLRHVISKYPYDAEDGGFSLLKNPEDISAELCKELATDLQVAGIRVHYAKITHLAYASEIASAMLKRQQAQAIISARKKIVEGAVTMVESTLNELQKKGVVDMDSHEKATFVTNLMTVLVSEDKAQPVVNLKS